MVSRVRSGGHGRGRNVNRRRRRCPSAAIHAATRRQSLSHLDGWGRIAGIFGRQKIGRVWKRSPKTLKPFNKENTAGTEKNKTEKRCNAATGDCRELKMSNADASARVFFGLAPLVQGCVHADMIIAHLSRLSRLRWKRRREPRISIAAPKHARRAEGRLQVKYPPAMLVEAGCRAGNHRAFRTAAILGETGCRAPT